MRENCQRAAASSVNMHLRSWLGAHVFPGGIALRRLSQRLPLEGFDTAAEMPQKSLGGLQKIAGRLARDGQADEAGLELSVVGLAVCEAC